MLNFKRSFLIAFFLCLALTESSVIKKPSTFCGPKSAPRSDGLAYNCDDIRRSSNESGVYQLSVKGNPDKKIEVFCKMMNQEKEYSSMLVQKRYDGSQSFNKGFFDYVYGFGSFYGEYWTGLEDLSRYAMSIEENGVWVMRIDLEDYDGYTVFAEYDFDIGTGPEFQVSLINYRGTAGDALFSSNGMAYSTYDRDQDSSSGSCSSVFGGSWWFSDCGYSNLNSHIHYSYGANTMTSMFWAPWRGFTALKKSEITLIAYYGDTCED